MLAAAARNGAALKLGRKGNVYRDYKQAREKGEVFIRGSVGCVLFNKFDVLTEALHSSD